MLGHKGLGKAVKGKDSKGPEVRRALRVADIYPISRKVQQSPTIMPKLRLNI